MSSFGEYAKDQARKSSPGSPIGLRAQTSAARA
jgi:hypothetical protein